MQKKWCSVDEYKKLVISKIKSLSIKWINKEVGNYLLAENKIFKVKMWYELVLVWFC